MDCACTTRFADHFEFLREFHKVRREAIWLLWPGNGNCFGVSHFHDRCDGKANTWIVIFNTD
jgi:hypothetical protein